MGLTSEQISAMDEARVERARRMTMEERFLAGLRLWSLAKETVRAGLRMQFPDASDVELEKMVRERMRHDETR